MKCPYDDLDCTRVDTSGMNKEDCRKCNRYNNGIRATGATPILGWIADKLRRKKKDNIDDLNKFMMSL
jgi:hypothetical protein